MKENHLKEIMELNKNIDNLKKDNFEELQKKEKTFLKLNEDNSKIISDKELKIKELKEQIKKLNESLLNYQKIKTDLENIALKQEDKINELGYKVTKIETILKNKNLEIKQNEDYAVQLMNIIKEQKVQMQNLVNNNQEKENDEINSLKNNIENLKNSIERKYNTNNTKKYDDIIFKKKFTFTVNNIKKWIYKIKDDKLEEITNNQLEIEKKENKKENPVPLMELELRKTNKINKSNKKNNYISNVNPLDIIKGEKEVQVLKMELISELEEYYLQINKNKKKTKNKIFF